MAIRYDANKGLGEQDYVKINEILTADENIEGDFTSLNYVAVVLKKSSIVLYNYEAKQTTHIGTFRSLKDIVDSGILDKKQVYLIYEQEKSPLFSQIVRLFIVKRVPIGIAQVGT